MKLAFVGAGACFANVAEDILAKCEIKKDKGLKRRVLHESLVRPGCGARYNVHYMDCGPELKRAEQKGEVFTYNISKGRLLSGAGNVATGEKFFRDAEWKVRREFQTNTSDQKLNLLLSIRGVGATNCGPVSSSTVNCSRCTSTPSCSSSSSFPTVGKGSRQAASSTSPTS